MTASGYYRGHPIFWNERGRRWAYEDGSTAIYMTEFVDRGLDGKTFDVQIHNYRKGKPCVLCGDGSALTIDDPDPCIGVLPGVKSACCGHGVERAYVVWDGGEVTVGEMLTEPPVNLTTS